MTVVNTNVAALAAQTSMFKNTRELEDAMAKLSSGHRINTAADDAAGLSIADRLDSQIRGLSQAIRNAQDGQNLIDTVEGASAETVIALQRLRELAVQASTDTNSSVDRSFLQKEANQLLSEINRIGSSTQWNGMNVLDGSFVNKAIQVGANISDIIQVGINDIQAQGIGNHVIRGHSQDVSVGNDALTNLIAAGTTVIAGFAGVASVVTTAGDSAREFAADVNNLASKSGVTADARTNLMISSVSADGVVQIDIGKQGQVVGSGGNVNGLSAVQINATVTTTDLTGLRNAINNVSGETGVTASFFNGDTARLMLTDLDGDDIVLSDFGHSTSGGTINAQAYDFFGTSVASGSSVENLTDGGTDSTTASGTVTLSSSQGFTVRDPHSTGYFGAPSFAVSSLDSVGDIDIGTVAGAQRALEVLDGAISMVNNQRSDLGAISNRLDNTISNLTNIVENTTASKSHIKDANFAAETSKLTKAQILNQAATSMLAQANASKQTVLALLQS